MLRGLPLLLHSCPLEVTIPDQVHQSTLQSNLSLHSVGKLNGVFALSPVHGRQVPHITHYGPAGHHHVDVGQHAVLAAVPEGLSKLWIILDGYREDGSSYFK